MSGCSSPTTLEPKESVTVAVSREKVRHPVAVKLNQEVVIALPPVEEPGHAWTLVLNDSRFLLPWTGLKSAPDGGATMSFLAQRQGRRPVRFYALPPGDREAVPSQAAEVVVTIE